MTLFGKSQKIPQTILGLDIDVSQVHLVELQNLNKTPTLRQQATIPYNSDCFSDGVLQDIDSFIEAIRPHINSCKTNNVALGLPAQWLNIIQVSLEADLSPEDIEENIGIEAERALSIPLDDIYVDYTPLPANDIDKLNFLMAACPSNIITSRIKALAELNLQVTQVSVNHFALANFVLSKANCALIYLHQTSADIIVNPADMPLLYDCTERLDQSVPDIMHSLWDLVHIQQQHLSVQKLYLAGDIVTTELDTKALTAQFQCPVQIVDPFPKHNASHLTRSVLAIALGHEVRS